LSIIIITIITTIINYKYKIKQDNNRRSTEVYTT